MQISGNLWDAMRLKARHVSPVFGQ
jgi:hypothetical protein